MSSFGFNLQVLQIYPPLPQARVRLYQHIQRVAHMICQLPRLKCFWTEQQNASAVSSSSTVSQGTYGQGLLKKMATWSATASASGSAPNVDEASAASSTATEKDKVTICFVLVHSAHIFAHVFSDFHFFFAVSVEHHHSMLRQDRGEAIGCSTVHVNLAGVPGPVGHGSELHLPRPGYVRSFVNVVAFHF